MTVFEKDGKLELDFNGKASVINLKDTEEALRLLVRMIATLDQRLQELERRRG